MAEKIRNRVTSALLAVLLFLLFCLGLCDYFVPSCYTLSAEADLPSYAFVSVDLDGEVPVSANKYCSAFRAPADLFGVIRVKKVEVRKFAAVSLIPGGELVGMKMQSDGVLVVGVSKVGTSSPAEAAGIRVKDVILRVNGTPVRSAKDLSQAIGASEGKCVTLVCRRGDEEITFSLTPVLSEADGRYKSGIWVKDTSSGIGTVTFIDPETGAFGALGHGICDHETGALMPFLRGTATDAVLHGIRKGTSGTPGELRGYLKTQKRGTVVSNTACGVYGVFSDADLSKQALPIGLSDTVHTGEATVRTTVDGEGVKEYRIEITAIRGTSATKSFTVRVTDEELLAKTGGIVQGMSGSPILQDGKLIGAVTHVLINDPACGYGIFIENMLSSMPESLL